MAVITGDVLHKNVSAPGFDSDAVVAVADVEVVQMYIGRHHRFHPVCVWGAWVLLEDRRLSENDRCVFIVTSKKSWQQQ